MSKPGVSLLVIFFAVLLGSALLVYLLLERTSPTRTAERAAPTITETGPSSSPAPTEAPRVPAGNESFFTELFGRDPDTSITEQAGREVLAARILLRFLIAALLAALLAYGRRRSMALQKRNPYVAQTQILLGVVAAAMMMIVGDSAARAFGIFAAASLVRFRTNIRDPKETTVLLICLGVGLAAGVGRLDMAIILTLFVLVVLWIMEHFESGQVFRTMELRVSTASVDDTHEVLKRTFAKHNFASELRQLEREEGGSGNIVYELSLGSSVNTDRLTEEILSADAKNVANLEWDQKKSSTYIYN